MQPNLKNFRKKPSKNFGFIAAIILIVLVVLAFTTGGQETQKVDPYRLGELSQQGKIEEIKVEGTNITATVKGEDKKLVSTKEDPSIPLTQYGIDPQKTKVVPQNPPNNDFLNFFLVGLLPVILIAGFFYFMMRQAQGANQQALGFGKSKARIFGNEKEKISFKDVAGAEESKEELEEVVEFLKFPKKFQDLGAKIPKGVLMIGPPGTGKTMLARAVAGEAKVPFFSISGSEFVEMFVGVGASRVRDLFSKAKKNAPCIIFIDEIDAVGRRRGSGLGGGHDEREQTLNQILVEMDGFEQGTNVIVMAATNRPDVLDPALLRPGRFDRQVTLDLPDRKARLAILKIHLKDKAAVEDLDLESMAGKTAGMSGADLSNVANEGAIIAARRNKKKLDNSDLNEAFEKVAIGPERKSKVMSEHEKELTAYHEGGHALVGHVLEHADPIHKVTIVSRGRTGGVTWSLPTEDRSYKSFMEFKDSMAMAMGGRIAEEIIYGHSNITTGAGSDLQQATSTARNMVTKYGMSSNLANQYLDSEDHSIVLDKELAHTKNYSEATARVIDDEIKRLLDEAAERARNVINENRKLLDKLAKELLKKETVEEKEINELFKTAKMPKAAVVS